MKYVSMHTYKATKAKVTACWLDLAGDGAPPPGLPVLACVNIKGVTLIQPAFLDTFHQWNFPYYEGNPIDVTVTHWLPMPDKHFRLPPEAFTDSRSSA